MSSPRIWTWTRDHDGLTFTISTDSKIIPLDSLNAAFASPGLFWAKPLPLDAMREMVDRSLCFGLYCPHISNSTLNTSTVNTLTPTLTPTSTTTTTTTTTTETKTGPLIGFARVITDYVSFTYLTDVYVLPEYQARGLGKWLIECVQEVIESMPHLRRSMAVTSRAKKNDAGHETGDESKSLVAWYGRMMKMTPITGSEPYTVLTYGGPGRAL